MVNLQRVQHVTEVVASQTQKGLGSKDTKNMQDGVKEAMPYIHNIIFMHHIVILEVICNAVHSSAYCPLLGY